LSPSLEVRGCTVRVRSRPHLGPERLAQGAGFGASLQPAEFLRRDPLAWITLWSGFDSIERVPA